MAGAVIAGRVLRRRRRRWATRTTCCSGVVAGLLAAIALTFVAASRTRARGWRSPSPGSSARAMGMQAAAARHIAVKDVTTVVVTSTITGLAADTLRARRQQCVEAPGRRGCCPSWPAPRSGRSC